MSEISLPLEIERKFLIAAPDAALLEEKSVKRLAIEQVYLPVLPAQAAASAAPAAARRSGFSIRKKRASPPSRASSASTKYPPRNTKRCF